LLFPPNPNKKAKSPFNGNLAYILNDEHTAFPTVCCSSYFKHLIV